MPWDIIALVAVGLVAFNATVGGFGTVETGNVGVFTRFGTVSSEEVRPGIHYSPWAEIREFSAKEIAVRLDDLTPKAADNLFIKDMDITVYYRVAADRIADIEIKYAGQSRALPEAGRAVFAPAYDLVATLTRNAAYQEVAQLQSLTVHTQRQRIADNIKLRLQRELDTNDPDTFVVSRTVIRNVVTDPAIEAEIQNMVNNQKRLEAMTVAVQIAEREAEVRLREAAGIAKANEVINNTLTPAYLQHEANKVLMEFARKGGTTTIVIPANMNVAPLINLPVGEAAPVADGSAGTSTDTTAPAAGPLGFLD